MTNSEQLVVAGTILAAALVGCANRDCAQVDSAIADLAVTKIEVVNDEEGTTNILTATPDLLTQFSKTNRVAASRYKKRYIPGHIVLHHATGNMSLDYFGNRTFGIGNCLFEIRTTNVITAQFK